MTWSTSYQLLGPYAEAAGHLASQDIMEEVLPGKYECRLAC
jgi:hypothetical protein